MDPLASAAPFSVLAPRERAELSRRCSLRTFRAGEPVFTVHDPVDHVWLVVSGLLAISTGSGADRVIINIQGPGELAGCLGRVCGHGHSVEGWALSPCRILAVPMADYARLMEGSAPFAGAVARLVSERLKTSNELRALLRLPTDRRVPLLLLWLHGRHGPDLPLTREDIASLAGATRETVVRILSPMVKKGWLQRGRGRLKIAKPELLAAGR